MATTKKSSSSFSTLFQIALSKQPTWTLKVLKVLAGEKVADEASFSKSELKLVITDTEATFTSPFAHVAVKVNGKKLNLELSRCANGGSEVTTKIDEAAFKFASSIWHVALRGVI